MITVIDTLDEYSRMREVLRENMDAIQLFLPSDINAHPCNNRISLIYYATPEKEWVMGQHHNDLPRMGIVRDGDPPNAYTLDGSFFRRFRFISKDASYFVNPPHIHQWYNIGQREYHTKFHSVRNVNDAIPLVMHLRMFREIAEKIWKHVDFMDGAPEWYPQTQDFYSRKLHYVLSELEENGMAVNPKTFTEVYGDSHASRALVGEYVYTKYNPYTLTGRPSNSWAGINFAAIPKKTGHRSSFVSRFGSTGRLVNFDFKSFHLFLLANYLGEDLPSEDVHTWLGCRYFNTDTLTPEQYEQSKVKTFGLLYGSERIEKGFLPFFDKVQSLRSELWETYQNIGYVRSGHHSRPIHMDDPSENKVFNYWVQNLETEVMVEIMYDMFSNKTDSRNGLTIANATPVEAFPILYTYDSVLFDCTEDDVDDLARKVLKVCKDHGYPVHIEVGANYGEMQSYRTYVTQRALENYVLHL